MGDTIAQTWSENVSKFPNDPLLVGVNTPRSGEDSLKLTELMELSTNLQQRVFYLDTTKTSQAQEIISLKKKSRIYADEESLGKEDASKHGRISDIDVNQDIYLVIVHRDELTIDATPLFVKTLIVDYKIYKEGKKNYFQIYRAGGNSQMYLTFSKFLKNFSREDLEVLWRLVNDRFVKTKPVDDMESFLMHTLKTMSEHHVKDNVWKSQQGLTKVKSWKLFDSCGVHCVTMQNILYYLLVEKMYPLTNHILHQMFNNVKLQVDDKLKWLMSF
uniref:Uncharacterized protein n=1 Tax=Tanacetum cinerariifolium TaxID=118510 RepID=A0A6L2K5U6_TANCI|nr:hypothetical protein [Tanacetum cinerariifolium]GEU44769.1 hypothetical protein [Tanacetum cinerariifolium]